MYSFRTALEHSRISAPSHSRIFCSPLHKSSLLNLSLVLCMRWLFLSIKICATTGCGCLMTCTQLQRHDWLCSYDLYVHSYRLFFCFFYSAKFYLRTFFFFSKSANYRKFLFFNCVLLYSSQNVYRKKLTLVLICIMSAFKYMCSFGTLLHHDCIVLRCTNL